MAFQGIFTKILEKPGLYSSKNLGSMLLLGEENPSYLRAKLGGVLSNNHDLFS